MRLIPIALALLLTGCASTGASFRSGVGDTFLEHPPYYAGSAAPPEARILVLPAQVQRGASQDEIFDPASEPGSPLSMLLAEVNGALDSLAGAAGWQRTALSAGGVAPDVTFGCAVDATNDCVARGDSVLGRRGTTMQLALRRPSPAWIAATQRALDSAGATHAMLVTLEVGQYWIRQTGIRGSKSVELGTGFVAPLPWLTSLETPISVLQLTAVLVDREGRGVRIGAEGFAFAQTRLLASAVGAQRLFTDSDVAEARTARRSDLADQPVAWRVALRQLAQGLVGSR